MARLLNRAYERLNKILSLAGSQAVNDIDLDQAFAVHPLTGVLQDKAVLPAVWGHDEVTLTGATNTVNLDLRGEAGSSIDRVDVDGSTFTSWPSRSYPVDDWNIIISSIGLSVVANPFNYVRAQFYLQDPGLRYFPVTEILDTLGMNGTAIQAAAGSLYYVQAPPIFYGPSDTLIYQVQAGAGNVSTRAVVRGWLAQRGSYERL